MLDVSVIIATRDRATFLRRTLTSLVAGHVAAHQHARMAVIGNRREAVSEIPITAEVQAQLLE